MKKMRINKASNLASLSVFPPDFVRRSAEPQASQPPRSQQPQQSFSQGPSSQRGCGFPQMSQSSLKELLINDQRNSSQEPDLSSKKASGLPPIFHKREDSHLAASTSSTRRWSSTSVEESKLPQMSGELEQRFGMMENHLSRNRMMLDSIQSDIMQGNRGTKEVFLETERIQHTLMLLNSSLQQLQKEQADAKASLGGGVKSILEELSKVPDQENLQKICLSLQKLQREICHTSTREIQDNEDLRQKLEKCEAEIDKSRKTNELNLIPSEEATKRAKENFFEGMWGLEEEIAKARSENIAIRSEWDKLAMEANFAREKPESIMKESEHKGEEMNLARNIEFTQLNIDHQRKLRESSESLHAAEEISRKLSMEVEVLKQEKEVLSNAEKRAADEVSALSQRVDRLQRELAEAKKELQEERSKNLLQNLQKQQRETKESFPAKKKTKTELASSSGWCCECSRNSTCLQQARCECREKRVPCRLCQPRGYCTNKNTV